MDETSHERTFPTHKGSECTMAYSSSSSIRFSIFYFILCNSFTFSVSLALLFIYAGEKCYTTINTEKGAICMDKKRLIIYPLLFIITLALSTLGFTRWGLDGL